MEERMKENATATSHRSEYLISEWQSEIRAGNQCYKSRDIDRALMHYERAKQAACSLFSQWKDTKEAIATVVVSYHNLADLYLLMGLPDKAEYELHEVHHYVLNAMRCINDNFGSHSKGKYLLQIDALQEASQLTNTALTQHLNIYGQHCKQRDSLMHLEKSEPVLH